MATASRTKAESGCESAMLEVRQVGTSPCELQNDWGGRLRGRGRQLRVPGGSRLCVASRGG
eukprot:15862070-Heterocapsa_arctica.AAC.1